MPLLMGLVEYWREQIRDDTLDLLDGDQVEQVLSVVIDLAAKHPPEDSVFGYCALCAVDSCPSDPAKHDPSCPWRRAKELVA